MRQICKKKFQSLCVCRNELSNPRYLTVSAEPRLQTTEKQLGLDSSIRHKQRWLKLIISLDSSRVIVRIIKLSKVSLSCRFFLFDFISDDIYHLKSCRRAIDCIT